MSQIFISYAREDRQHAERLARALAGRGWSVWWDRTIPAGRSYDEVIEEALHQAGCVLVLWSASSVKSQWVSAEAQEGADRNILVPVLIEDGVKIPLGFRRLQAAALVGWQGSPEDPSFQQLTGDVGRLLGNTPQNEGLRPSPRPPAVPSPPPPPSPDSRNTKVIGGSVALGVVVVAAILMFARSDKRPTFQGVMLGSCDATLPTGESMSLPVSINPRQEGSGYVMTLMIEPESMDFAIIPQGKSYRVVFPPNQDIDSVRLDRFQSKAITFRIFMVQTPSSPPHMDCSFSS